MSNLPTTIVLLDPTSPDGETALDMLDSVDDHVALVVLLGGPSAQSLRDFATAERIDVTTAAWIYLDQVTARLAYTGYQVQAITASGSDAVAELADLAATTVTRRVLLPTSFRNTVDAARKALASRISAPVVVAHAPAFSG
jgi:hypothetical protein